MVGATHINGPHDILYYEKPKEVSSATGIAIGSEVPTLSEVAPDYSQQSTTPTVMPEPTSSPSLGGSGY